MIGLLIVAILVAVSITATSSVPKSTAPDSSRPAASSPSSPQTSDTSDSSFFLDFRYSTASQIMDQLLADGYCTDVEQRDGLNDYPSLMELYDKDQLRGCNSSSHGGYFFVWAQQDSTDMTYRGPDSAQSVLGSNWAIEFADSEPAAMVTEVAERYGGTVK